MSERTPFVRFFVGILLVATGVHASCPIEVSPLSVVVRYGDPVSINCSTSEMQFEGIGWEATEGGQSLQQVNHLTWMVKTLTKWTSSPSCFFNPSPDSPLSQCTVSPKVTLYTFPETIRISSSVGSNGVMNKNKEYNLTCEIHNVAPVQYLSVRWYRGDTVVYTDTFDNPSKEPVNRTFVFRFKPTERDNGVTFRCEAHLNLEPEGPRLNVSSKEFNTTVYFGPYIRCNDPLILEGETLQKHCLVTGNPIPTVIWLKDGQPIDPAKPLHRENAGIYTVDAEGFSTYKQDIQILVKYGPELKCPTTYTVLENMPHNLTCIVEGFPEPNITWSKEGEEVERPQILTRQDAGQYLITASNSLTSISVTVDIIVLYPPSQIFELEDSEVDVGSTVWLKCSSMGNPRPSYSWKYYQTANVKEENDDGVSRLLILNATSYNMGSYTCRAGNVTKTARVTVKGVKQECPLEVTPDRMVIQYQSMGLNVTCQPTSTGNRNIERETRWHVGQGTIVDGANWLVDTNKDWDPRPVCSATFTGLGICQKHVNFTLYKTPDSVSIRRVDHLGPALEGGEFQLRCDITSVAPAQNLAVRWYRGNETFEPRTEGSLRVTECLPGNDTGCSIGTVRSPLNVSSTISIVLERKHNGAEFRCEAQLDLGPEGPQPPPLMMSGPVNVTVNYKPTINTTKLPKTIPVFRGYPEELVCEADGHPPPTIQWVYNTDKTPRVSGETLVVFEAGFYNCSATNDVASISHEVEVILKEDYLPLIAGFVAVTVVAISIIFLFIYSIYYKNTRMRRYSLKNPKLSTHNGNVAHNSWDSQFPMTKLS